MAASRARGALAAVARTAVVSLVAWISLLPAPAIAAGHGNPHGGAPGKSALAPGHNKAPAAVANPAAANAASGHGGLAAREAAAAAAAAMVNVGPSPPAPAAAPTPAARLIAPAVARFGPLRGAPVVAAGPAGGPLVVAAAAPVPALAAPARRNYGLETFPPPIVLPPGPEGARVAIALFTLPLLVAVWFWALIRLSASVRAYRAAGIRSALALQLGVPAEQLAGIDMTGLRRLRDGIAFDELTGVLRRAAGLASMDRELARSARAEHPVAVAFIDVDGLKATNDARGHEAGDELLRRVASLLRGRLRAQDLIFRYGGDEFVCVLPGSSRQRAERIIGDLRRSAGEPFSYGVVQAAPRETSADVIARADSLQYLDKESRRAGR